MRMTGWIRIGLPGLLVTISGCATSNPVWTVAPLRLALAEAAVQPCALARLPERPTQLDLEAAYVARGAQIVACDAARRLAVETLMAERGAVDHWWTAMGGNNPR